MSGTRMPAFVAFDDRGYVSFDSGRDAYHRCMQARGYVGRPRP